MPARLAEREGLVHLIPVLVPEYLLRLSRFQAPLLLIYLRDGRVGVYTARNYGTKPIRYVTHHFRDGHRIRNGFYQRKKKRLLRDFCRLFTYTCNLGLCRYWKYLRSSAGDNDRRSKHFCSIAVLFLSFTWEIVKARVIRLRVIESPNARDQIAFCSFHSFLVEVQANASYIHVAHA